jgi:hypothetical protein
VLGIATLGLGLFIAVAVTLLTRPSGRATPIVVRPAATQTVVIRSPPTPRRPARPKPAPLIPRAQTPVLVLNGNGIRRAAATAAEIVRARGYPVTATADAPQQNYSHSTVMYKRGFAREAKRLSRDLNVPALQPLEPLTAPGGTRARLVLIVGEPN